MILGLAGAARCGKDTVAEMLKDYAFDSCSFAGPIKEMIGILLQMSPFVLEEMKDKTLSHLGCTPRVLMQTLGTEWGRDVVSPLMSSGDGLWVRLMREKLELRERLGLHTVITDVRFQDEADMIHRMGGAVAHIYRRDCTKIATADHPSEKGIVWNKDKDYILTNHQGLAELRKRVEVVADMVKADQQR